jgi:hypothetical protein
MAVVSQAMGLALGQLVETASTTGDHDSVDDESAVEHTLYTTVYPSKGWCEPQLNARCDPHCHSAMID